MSNQIETFDDIISAKLNSERRNAPLSSPLRIAVLGPNLDNADDPGTRKRRQIHDVLERDGHYPFFPETYVDTSQPFDTWIEQERVILSDSAVDLVIVLNTPTSIGVILEIGNFVSAPVIRNKTAIMHPIEYYTPDDSLAANTIRAYLVQMPYTEEQMSVCQLVSECRIWVRRRQIGEWPGLAPHEI